MSSAQIFTGIALIIGIAVSCQVIAKRAHLPALVLLLPAGFAAGIAFDAVDPIGIFGSAFTPMVSLAVALILFHGGLELYESRLDHGDRRIVRRLVAVGSLVTWLCAGLASYHLLGLSVQLAALLGAVVIVSGPTVIGPLMRFVRPQPRVRRILVWEGTMIDPVGALIAVILFQAVEASSQPSVAQGLRAFATGIGVGLAFAALGVALIWAGLRLTRGDALLGTEILVGAVILSAGLADAVSDDAGLVTGIAMGMTAPLLDRRPLSAVKPFFDTVVNLAIGILFVSISALVTPASLAGVVLPALGVTAVLMLVARPVAVLLLTAGSTLPARQRAFVAWMAPRGIVAASTAAGFSAALADVPGGTVLLPATFVIIAVTVTGYSLTAVPVADLLRIREPAAAGAADQQTGTRSSGRSSSQPRGL